MLMVVVVVHEGSDVVEDAGGVKPLPLARVAVVEPEPAEAVKHFKREAGHLLRMGTVVPIYLREVTNARCTHVLDDGWIVRGEELLPEHTPAQTLGADLDAVHARGVHQGVHHHGARQHDVGAVGLEPGDPPALRCRQGDHPVDQVAQRVPGELVPMHLSKRIIGGFLRHGGQRAKCPAHGHDATAVGDPRIAPEDTERMAAKPQHVVARGHWPRHERISHTHSPKRLAHRFGEQTTSHPAHLDAATAEFGDETITQRGAIDRPDVAVSGFLSAGDDPCGKPSVGDGGEHLRTIRGIADGAGGDRAHLVDIRVPAEAGEQACHARRARDGGIRDWRPGWGPLSKTHDFADLVHQAERAVGQRVLKDHKAEGI